ncbi:MAG: hypothetical protein ACYDEN_06575 [Acidimicrobiales bacterium]
MSAGRILGGIRLAWGAALLAVPRRCIRLAPGAPTDIAGDAVAVARVLGARQVAQAIVELAAWPRLRRTGAAADLLHASSGVALAAADQRWRGVAVADTALASGFAVAGLAAR